MPKNVEKMTIIYSPNFDMQKRNKKKIKYLIFHYTGMNSDKSAIKKLTDIKSKVSTHYYVTKMGKLIQIVPDLYVAWHAGKSSWKNHKSINKYSIGIEISNPGHQHGYKKFNKKQINSLIKLSKFLINKYKIKKINILGHSDISPLRKKDPGEKFPWKKLAKKNIGVWHNLDDNYCKKLRRINDQININAFINNLRKLGYFINSFKLKNNQKIIKSFQRRFRPGLINGKVDKECVEILKSLI